MATTDTLAARIERAMGTRRYAPYHELLSAVFPDERSHRCSSNGGPPGCAMAFGRTLRRMGWRYDTMGSNAEVWRASNGND